MSFGFSVGDFIALIHLAKKTYKNCVEAGSEYNDIAREIRSLYSVLKPLRDEAEKPESGLFRQDQASAQELKNSIDGCGHILEDLQILLAKYEGLSTAGEPVSAPKKLWHRFRFSTKIEQLAAVRAKLISYTSTISVLLDAVQLRATGRVENKIDHVSSQVAEGFESLKKVILDMAVKARAEQRGGSTLSLLSLSTYAGDDKEIWQEFRRELVAMGFRSKALDRHKDLLQAYMLKLDQSGVLDEVGASSNQNTMEPWWKKHAFSETVDTFPGLQPVSEDASTLLSNQTEKGKVSTPPPPKYSMIDINRDSSAATLVPSVDQELNGPKARRSPVLRYIDREDTSVSEAEPPTVSSRVATSNVKFALDTDSEESEKETNSIQRPRRSRTKRRHRQKPSNTNTDDLGGDFLTTIPPKVLRVSEQEGNVSSEAATPLPTQTGLKQTSDLSPDSLTKFSQYPRPESAPTLLQHIYKPIDQPPERRQDIKEVRDSANKPTLQNLENPSATSRERGRPTETKSRNVGVPGRAESPRSRKATPIARDVRPLPTYTWSDPVRRVKLEYRPETKRRPTSETSKPPKTRSLGAVAFGLAGLSLILGMRRRNKVRGPSARSASDGYYSYYSDSYTQTSESEYDDSDFDSEDDKNLPGDERRGQENDWKDDSPKYSQGKQPTVFKTTRGGKSGEGSLSTNAVNAFRDSSSGSDSEQQNLKASDSRGKTRSEVGEKSGSGSSTPRENMTAKKATKANVKSKEDSGTGSAEKLASMETASKATETSPSGGQAENLERRFGINSHT